MDKRQMIAELVAKTGVKIDEDDPAFLLVELNILMLENSNNLAAKKLEETIKNFENVSTRNIDNFISVSNEALSKFVQRTNELKETLDALKIKSEQNMKQEQKFTFLWWLLPLIFSIGILVGVLAAK